MRILFSPIGNTDPIKYFRDGSMIHICRHYRPDVVYLYLSYEMIQHQKKDNRYTVVLECLGEMLGHRFEVRLIERPELREAQQYDFFYKDFHMELEKIISGMYEGDELILNMASGTPAMKSALLMLATLNEYRYLPIQVHSPNRASNEEYDDREGENWRELWEANEDNDVDAENRCEEVKSLNLIYLLKVNSIKKFVEKLDYTAALLVADEIRADLPEDVYTLLRIAKARTMLDRQSIQRINVNNFPVYPVKEPNNQRLFEYALILKIKADKEEYADFVRGLTPLVLHILEILLEKKTSYKINELIQLNERNKGALKWDIGKLEITGLKSLLDKDYGDFRGGIVYSGHIAKILKAKCDEAELLRRIDEITEVEQKIRNVAAHEIQTVTEDWIISKSGKSAKDILNNIKFLMKQAKIYNNENDWNAYNEMNKRIIDFLQ